MDRNDLNPKQRLILTKLETARTQRKGRRHGPLVSYLELMEIVGPRYGARIFEMRELGFLIPLTKSNPKFSYCLEAYPSEWTGAKINVSNQQELSLTN